MYINSFFYHHCKNKPIKEYKDLLKQITTMNLRRASKYNILAIYGALNCLTNINIPPNLDIYSSTEHGAIKDISKILDDLNSDYTAVMPFDFLMISSSNIGFYISKALGTNGNNISITSKDESLKQALQLAYKTLLSQASKHILVGYVDEALDELNYKSYENKEYLSYDKSYWFLLSKESQNHLIELTSNDIFDDIDALLTKLHNAKQSTF